jgi:hypothetical protein
MPKKAWRARCGRLLPLLLLPLTEGSTTCRCRCDLFVWLIG